MKTEEKIFSLPLLLEKVNIWRENGNKIVFTNGCFDLLHLGHVDYLEKASEFGDCLIVGLNTDSSVRKLKGPQRPLTNEKARARVLAALQFVNAVVLFSEDTPIKLIENIAPDVLIKGKDYEISNIAGADFVMANGGKVATIELVDGFSTSKLVEKIKKTGG